MPESQLDVTLGQLNGIDRLIHEPSRLLILCTLFVLDSADFVYLLRRTGLSRGNLSTHMRKLETAGFIHVDKTFQDRQPLTRYRIAPKGRRALRNYRQRMLDGLSTLSDER